MRYSAEQLNISFLLIAYIAACAIPFDLLLFSYAVLGPAHYLSQITWLHDRDYFCYQKETSKYLWVICVLSTLLMMSTPLLGPYLWLLILAFALCMVLPANNTRFTYILMAAAVTLVAMRHLDMLLLAMLVPTVIHVFIFTVLFMWCGARRSKQPLAYVACGLLVGLAASFFLLPVVQSSTAPTTDLWFTELAHYLQLRFFGEANDAHYRAVTGFLGFAYTYHYLNWFVKVERIGWYASVKPRWRWLLPIYLAAVSLYAIDYYWGLAALLFLSILHVLLEFPLNWRQLRALV